MSALRFSLWRVDVDHAVLEEFIPENKPEVDQPKYLSDSSSAFPGTAVTVVRLKTSRVCEAALIDGLGMKKAEILSNMDLQQAAAQKRIHQFDIDAMQGLSLQPDSGTDPADHPSQVLGAL